MFCVDWPPRAARKILPPAALEEVLEAEARIQFLSESLDGRDHAKDTGALLSG
jgi:hypothetical protein